MAEQKVTVRVYTAPSCIQCTMTKKLMNELGISFFEEDATQPTVTEAIKYLDFTQAPVIVAGESGDDMWQGFQPARIKALAKRINKEEGK